MNSFADGGSSRVSIPHHLRKTLQSIREITGKQHSDEDIFAVYKESFNDPHETAQKLLFLDTFHEVKSKREKKKENLAPITQGSDLSGRRNVASSNTHQDASNGRSASYKREIGANHVSGGPRVSLPATNKARNLAVPRGKKGLSNHKAQDYFTATVNKGLAEKNRASKSTSSSVDEVEPETSRAISESVAAPVSVSVVQNHMQDATSAQISQPVMNNQPAELQSSTLGLQDPSLISASHCSSQADQATENETASNKGKAQSLLKSDVGKRSHVTFPFHLQVAEVLQNGLTFGSFDSNLVKEASSNNGASGGDDSTFESSHGTGDDEGDSSPTTNGIPGVASAREGALSFFEVKDHRISSSAPGAELVRRSDNIVASVEDELKGEVLSNTQTHQIAYGQAPFSVYGLVPSLSAIGQPVNTEAAETQPGNSNAPAISLVSYPPDQCSIAAASQQATHLFRQQYPPSFFPYGPYYSPFYMPPPYIHQFLSPNGIPQQSYFPPGAALAAPTHIPPVGDTENPPTTNPSPHASSTVATHIPSATAFNSIHSEEQTSPPMTESAAAWIGQGLGNLQVNPMYNLALQGQPLGFPVVQAGHNGLMGVHQPSHSMAVQPTTYQTVTPPPHTTMAMAEPIGHSHIAYPQVAVTNRVNN
ncbi:hypothetical protein EUTSA_v10011305mg [Eutrema salsugineum]|uniref:GBF-interacting protein 1 N-terminal domain-containing protein n=1 Tax=Eutrema salsugineum TaxID=72664 RepID=V4JWP5_EUTSA|nr:GBF-interacting protein 1-like isoform X2 [Eutrema salsugineum]ESQ29885.1 hypothetical protein EUTSA_v10011305mg [Eutrema salsugineum]